MFERFEVIRDAEMRQYTTLKLGGKADWLAFPRSTGEIAAMFAEAAQAGIPVTVIGRGLTRQAPCWAPLPRPRRRRDCQAWNSLPAFREPSAAE